MASKALNQPSSSPKSSEEEKDPLEEAQRFTKQMAAGSIIESEVAKSKAGAEEAKAKAEEAKAKAERARSGGGEGGEGPFKVKGAIDYGTFDVQERERQATEEAKTMRKEKDDELKEERQKREAAEEKAHGLEIEGVQKTLTSKIESLEKTVAAGMSQKNFAQQAAEIRELATELGFHKPDPNLAGAGDAVTRVEIMKLTMEEKRLDREFKWKMRQDDKQWQLDMEKIRDERAGKEAELAQQQKRDEMIASAPQMIGGAIAKGMMESKSGGETPAAPKTSQRYELPVPQGEEGVTHCPKCGTEMGVGPTAKSAICAKCNTKVFIKRVGKSEKPVAEESGERSREEED